MAKNDTKIRELLKVIETKKNKLGDKPRANWNTNGIFKFDKVSHTNINTINNVEICVDILANILNEKAITEQAAKLLEVEYVTPKWGGFTFEEWLHDLKLRTSIITWDAEKKKLNLLEIKLSSLRSEDAKTEDAILDIMDELS